MSYNHFYHSGTFCFRLFGKVILGFVFLFSIQDGEGGNMCPLSEDSLIMELQSIACATDNLREAVQKDDLLQRIGQINFFANLYPSDVVRSVESLSFFNRSLRRKIKKAHQKYQDSGKRLYTLSIASYPADVKKNSCSRHKTINFDSGFEIARDLYVQTRRGQDISDVYQSYSVIPGREPRVFQVRWYQKKFVLCEQTYMPYKQRLARFCGRSSGINSSCKKDMISSCDSLDRNGAKETSQAACISLDKFSSLSGNFLLNNKALEMNYCPDGCSYYTQMVQRVYKKRTSGNGYCSDNYLIVHCGSKKDSSDYNLNIREINNLCSDFNNLPFCV